ncbi:MAG: hypothetical protein V4479_00775 [Actinomycetota bacterium]
MTGSPSDAGIVGVFINGEKILPHAPGSAKHPDQSFPISALLDRIFDLARTHGSDLRERVLVRNWSDSAIAGEWGPAVGPLQRRLVQLMHLPPAGIRSPQAPSAADTPSGDELERAVAQRASRWAINTSLTEPGSQVTAVVVGSDSEALFGKAVRVVRMSVAWSGDKAVSIDDPKSLTPTLTIGAQLWS